MSPMLSSLALPGRSPGLPRIDDPAINVAMKQKERVDNFVALGSTRPRARTRALDSECRRRTTRNDTHSEERQ